jgi:hypothetical protein
MGDADHYAVRGAEDLPGLVEDDLNVAGILAVVARQLVGPRAGLDVHQPPDAAFGLRDDLVGEHQYVAVTGDPADRAGQERGEVVARPNLRQSFEGGGADHRPSERAPPRTDGCGRGGPTAGMGLYGGDGIRKPQKRRP